MSTEAKANRLMKDSDLAERWGMDADNLETVHDIVRERRVPFLWIGRGEINLSRISWRCVRFRERDIEKWEEHQLVRTQDTTAKATVLPPDDDDGQLGGHRPVRRYQV